MTRLNEVRGLIYVATLILVFLVNSLLGSDFRITHQERSLQPGEVIFYTVLPPEPLVDLQAKAFGKQFLFSTASSGEMWEGLVGVDLDIEAGKYKVEFVGLTPSGQELRSVESLEIAGKEFPVRRLSVDSKYVSPPAEVMERINRESKLIRELFGKTTGERHWKGRFLRPVPGKANSSFGKRSVLNGQPRSPHTGTDFTSAEGTPVKAPNAGKVVLVRDLYFAGNTVVIDHGQGLYSYFAHLSAFKVQEGEEVEPGKVVGLVGATGRVTGPHLHWTLRLAETRVDPLSLMEVLETAGAQ